MTLLARAPSVSQSISGSRHSESLVTFVQTCDTISECRDDTSLVSCLCLRHNRQFRYEERDANGVVHGRYGYYDQHGKLQVVNYTADPYKGFHAEGEHVPQPQYRR